jgi:hypothetical protein
VAFGDAPLVEIGLQLRAVLDYRSRPFLQLAIVFVRGRTFDL